MRLILQTGGESVPELGETPRIYLRPFRGPSITLILAGRCSVLMLMKSNPAQYSLCRRRMGYRIS